MAIIKTDQANYRLAWKHPDAECASYDKFLFTEPKEAKSVLSTMRTMFPEYDIWLEDRSNNRIEI